MIIFILYLYIHIKKYKGYMYVVHILMYNTCTYVYTVWCMYYWNNKLIYQHDCYYIYTYKYTPIKKMDNHICGRQTITR